MRTLHRHVRPPAKTDVVPRSLWKYCHATDRAVVHPTLDARRSIGAASEGWQALVLAMAAGATGPHRAPTLTATRPTIIFFITRCIGSAAQSLARLEIAPRGPRTRASPTRGAVGRSTCGDALQPQRVEPLVAVSAAERDEAVTAPVRRRPLVAVSSRSRRSARGCRYGRCQ